MLKRSVISFERDESSRYLPWLIAFMVFLAALSIAGLFVLSDITSKVGKGFSNKITIQIPVSGSKNKDKLRKNEALRILRSSYGVKKARLMKTEEVLELLKPWLGESEALKKLPIPNVIDVEIDRKTNVSEEKLKTILLPKVPDVLVDDHHKWLKNLLNALRSIEIIALSIVLLIVLTTIGTVIFTTRTSMGLQRETISILHFIGAQDHYIANQFAIRAAWLGVKGGLVGISISVPIFFGFRLVIGSLSTGLMPELTLYTAGWISVFLIIPTVATIAMFTAYTTALKSLNKLL